MPRAGAPQLSTGRAPSWARSSDRAACSGSTVSPAAAREAARAAEEREERELVAQHAAEAAGAPVDDTPAVDPEQAALSLLRAQLGARPVDE